jgi:predicted nucleotidyltransferase
MPNGVLLEKALEFCSVRHGLAVETILRRLEEGDREMHSSLRYGLAKELSCYLACLGSVFHAVYVYGSSISESSNPASDIDVIVVVERRRDEIASVLRRLDLALTAQFRRLVGLVSEPVSLLDIHVIDKKEQAERSGYGAVLDGLHTRPICLWRSDPAVTGALRTEGPRRSFKSRTVPTASTVR